MVGKERDQDHIFLKQLKKVIKKKKNRKGNNILAYSHKLSFWKTLYVLSLEIRLMTVLISI